MAILVDSSVIIDLERSGRPLEALSAMYPGEDIAISAMTVSELLVGVYRADSEERRLRRSAYLEPILSATLVLPFDAIVARTHAQLVAELLRGGNIIGAHDLIIAATALTFGYSLLTDNVREFSRIPGLRVLQPSW